MVASLIKLSSIIHFENIQDYKIHLASTDGQSEPLDIFLTDKNRWIGWNEYKIKKCSGVIYTTTFYSNSADLKKGS